MSKVAKVTSGFALMQAAASTLVIRVRATQNLTKLEPFPMSTAKTVSPIQLFVDAACDVPDSYFSDNKFKVLPVTVEVGKERYEDTREPKATSHFHANVLTRPRAAIDGRSTPPTPTQISEFLHRHYQDADQVIGLHVTSTRSAIFTNARQAANKMRVETYSARIRAGQTQQIMLDCIDSLGLFAGYGAQALEMAELAASGKSYNAVLAQVQQNAKDAYTFAAPQALEFVVERARSKGDHSISEFAAMAGKLLNIIPIVRCHRGETAPIGRQFGRNAARRWLIALAERQITERKLRSRHVVFSYSGDLSEIESLPSFVALQKTAKNAKVDLHLAPMSMTNAVNIGPNALSLGFIGFPPSGM